MIKVFGEEFPEITNYKVEYEPIGEFVRNANGNLIGDLIAFKAKVSCKWDMLEDRFYKIILKHTKPYLVDVEYYDPEIGGMKTAKMYASPASAQIAMKSKGEGRIWWKNVAVGFIEW